MQFIKLLSTFAFAATATAAVIAAPIAEDTSVEVRTNKPTTTCPADKPNYCGWFDQVNNLPPRCLPPRQNPPVIPRPICGRKTFPYCARNPGQFVPYDATHNFCRDDGIAIVICIDVDLEVTAVQKLLGELFCVVDKAVVQLGLQCLTSGVCASTWVKLQLGCTAAELAIIVKVGVSVVVKGVVGLLGRILNVGVGIGINIGKN